MSRDNTWQYFSTTFVGFPGSLDFCLAKMREGGLHGSQAECADLDLWGFLHPDIVVGPAWKALWDPEATGRNIHKRMGSSSPCFSSLLLLMPLKSHIYPLGSCPDMESDSWGSRLSCCFRMGEFGVGNHYLVLHWHTGHCGWVSGQGCIGACALIEEPGSEDKRRVRCKQASKCTWPPESLGSGLPLLHATSLKVWLVSFCIRPSTVWLKSGGEMAEQRRTRIKSPLQPPWLHLSAPCYVSQDPECFPPTILTPPCSPKKLFPLGPGETR